MNPADISRHVGTYRQQPIISHDPGTEDPAQPVGAAISVKFHEAESCYIIHALLLRRNNDAEVSVVHAAEDADTNTLFLNALSALFGMEKELGAITIRLVGDGAEDFVERTQGCIPGLKLRLVSMIQETFQSNYRNRLDSTQHRHAFDPAYPTYLDPDTEEFRERYAGQHEIAPWDDLESWAVVGVKVDRAHKHMVVAVHARDGSWSHTSVLARRFPINNAYVPEAYRAGVEELAKHLEGHIPERVYLSGAGSKKFAEQHVSFLDGLDVLFMGLGGDHYQDKVVISLPDKAWKSFFSPFNYAFGSPPKKPASTSRAAAHHQAKKAHKVKEKNATAATTPFWAGHWAAVAVKWHQARNRYVTHVHVQDGTDSTHRTFLAAPGETDMHNMYREGMDLVKEVDQKQNIRTVYCLGAELDAVLEDHRNAPVADTTMVLRKLGILIYNTRIAPAIASSARRYAFNPSTDIYCHPVMLSPRTTHLTIHTDASQVLDEDRTPGYGHGTVITNEDTGTVHIASTWISTEEHHNPIQFELDGAMLAINHCVEAYPSREGIQDRINITLYCDNIATINTLTRIGSTINPNERIQALHRHLGKKLDVDRYPWLHQTNISITARWVKGHNGDPFNEAVDKLAVSARKHHYGMIDHDTYDNAVHTVAFARGATTVSLDPENYTPHRLARFTV